MQLSSISNILNKIKSIPMKFRVKPHDFAQSQVQKGDQPTQNMW